MINRDSTNWFVLCTKPRNELMVTERLTRLGVEVYTPTKIEVRQWSDRKKKSDCPFIAFDGVGSIIRERVGHGI